MTNTRNISGHLFGVVALGLALLVPAAPAQSSEVVKLARLVITGKRQPTKPPATPQPVQDRNGGAEGTGPQSRAGDGELHASTPARRGVAEALTLD